MRPDCLRITASVRGSRRSTSTTSARRRARCAVSSPPGRDVALLSDAGTPAISDPGAIAVAAVRAAGFAVVPIPGPSAAVAALSVAGLPGTVRVHRLPAGEGRCAPRRARGVAGVRAHAGLLRGTAPDPRVRRRPRRGARRGADRGARARADEAVRDRARLPARGRAGVARGRSGPAAGRVRRAGVGCDDRRGRGARRRRRARAAPAARGTAGEERGAPRGRDHRGAEERALCAGARAEGAATAAAARRTAAKLRP